MCMFLKPLVLDLHNLYQIGMTFLVDGRTVSLRAMLILATMDLQARAYVLNMTQHNGLNGCLYCKEPGVVVASGKGNCRSYPYNESPILRSEEEARNSATLARNEGKRIDGFFGENVFMYLPYFSMTKNVTIDYMHGVLLGVTKYFSIFGSIVNIPRMHGTLVIRLKKSTQFLRRSNHRISFIVVPASCRIHIITGRHQN